MFGSKIKLDRGLLEQCRQQAKAMGYSSVEEFITHVLEKELKTAREESKETKTELLNRLKGLGYLE